MNKFRTVGLAVVIASGLTWGIAGMASAADKPATPPAKTGSAEVLADLFDLLGTGSAGSGSSINIGVGADPAE